MRSHLRDAATYLTLFHAVVDFRNRELTYLSCGHLPQLLWANCGAGVRKLESQTFPIGLLDGSTLGDARPTTVRFDSGDRLILFTDGLTDMVLEGGVELGLEGVLSRLGQSSGPASAWSSLEAATASR